MSKLYGLQAVKNFASKIPKMQQQTLNAVAYSAHKITIATVKKQFVNRNKYMLGSFRVLTAKHPKDNAVLGTYQRKMRTQELGMSRLYKEYIPDDDARVGKDYRRKVSGKNTLRSLYRRNIQQVDNMGQAKRIVNENPQAVVEVTFSNGQSVIYGKGTKKKMRKLYSRKKTVSIKPRPFLIPSGKLALRASGRLWRTNAQKYIHFS